jgi:hypothetical protein
MSVSNSSPQRTKALEIAQGVIVRAARKRDDRITFLIAGF